MSYVNYDKSSQYYFTNQTSWCLNLLELRIIDPHPSDITYTLGSEYENDPYKLAYDLYNDEKLWWIFMILNPDAIKDPIYDMKPNMTINIPTSDRVKSTLGV